MLGVEMSTLATLAKWPNGQNNEKTSESPYFRKNDVFCPNGQMAKVAKTSQYTFSDKVEKEDLPSVLWGIYDGHEETMDRDKMMLGSLNVISGILPASYYGIYSRKRVYAPLFNIVYGRYASSKGELEAVRCVAQPIKKEMRRKYEVKYREWKEAHDKWETQNKKERGEEPQEPVPASPFLAANSSASAVYRALDANEGWGLMFETEGDTFNIIFKKNEYGDYSDLMRKAHHHETVSMVRVTDKVNIEIEEPRLAVFITCTGSQLAVLLGGNNLVNGLASRFLFYELRHMRLVFNNVFDKQDKPIEEIYKAIGAEVLKLYHALGELKANSIQFVLTQEQNTEFCKHFSGVLSEQFSILGDGIEGFVYRIALECFRYAMVLTALRRLSDWDGESKLFDDDEKAIVCDARDFKTAMTIIECLVNHTARVFSVIGNNCKDPFRDFPDQPAEAAKSLYAALPDVGEFRLADALRIAEKIGISGRTARRMVGDFSTKYQVLARIRQGVYVKCESGTTDGGE